jgi:hypothetical protein
MTRWSLARQARNQNQDSKLQRAGRAQTRTTLSTEACRAPGAHKTRSSPNTATEKLESCATGAHQRKNKETKQSAPRARPEAKLSNAAPVTNLGSSHKIEKTFFHLQQTKLHSLANLNVRKNKKLRSLQ